MSRSNKHKSYNCQCCMADAEEKLMVQCAVTALEKMRDMFQVALLSPEAATSGGCVNRCTMNEKCEIKRCPFRGETKFAPNTLRRLCAKNKTSPAMMNPRRDRDAMLLQPGEVGLRGDRATFHLGGRPLTNPRIDKDGRPTGASYYHVQPRAAAADGAIVQGDHLQPKYLTQVLPVQPATTDQLVGPVTGLPVDGDEDVFVVRLRKRYSKIDMPCLQMEVRLPKVKEDEKPKDTGTQFADQDYLPPAPIPSEPMPAKSKKKGKKGKKGGDTKKGKKATKQL